MNKNRLYIVFLIGSLLFCCEREKEISSINPVKWSNRIASQSQLDSLEIHATYLSIYSQIYSLSEHKTHNLTVTVSMRNTNMEDSVFIRSAQYYDTNGKLIRSYFEKPIYLKPMETVEIVIDEIDQEGGTGANFLFQWSSRENNNDPFFEGVMISTTSQQGLSFSTQGIKLK